MVGFLLGVSKALRTIGIGLDHVRSFVRHEVSPSNISRTVYPIITKFYTNIHTEIVCCRIGYDVIIYFWSEVIAKKTAENTASTASGGIPRERFKR